MKKPQLKFSMVNNEELKKIYIEAEKGDSKSVALIRELLRPRQNDSVDLIYEKLRIFQRIFFIDSFKYSDANFHKEIDKDHRFYGWSMKKFSMYDRGGDNPNGICNSYDYTYSHFTVDDNLEIGRAHV